MIDERKLDIYRQQLNNYFVANSGSPFTSFDHKFWQEHELYKSRLRVRALDILAAENWKASDVGSGVLIGRLIEAIELKENNLLDRGKYGPASVSHRCLLNARSDEQQLRYAEELIYGLYTSKLSDEVTFDRFADLAERTYPLLGFLFFIKNERRYVPIRPARFDEVFAQLGIELKTRQRCSWANYSQFCAVMEETRHYLSQRLTQEVRLVDAHSFLWTHCWLPKEKGWEEAQSHDVWSIPESREITSTKSVPPLARGTTTAGDGGENGAFTVDFLEQARRQLDIGRESEDRVIEYEVRRLKAAGREDLARQVTYVGNIPSWGYDIKSFEVDGTDRQIEVKTIQVNGRRRSFFISAAEVGRSETETNYYLFLVTRVDNRPHSIAYIRHPQLRNPTMFSLEPCDYQVRFEEIQ